MVKGRKVKADCRADTRGGPWAGIPVCVIESAAYRDCSVHARAVLVELVSRMRGYNNGKLALSQRELVSSLRCSPRKVVRALAELVEHGFLDVSVEGKWKERMARQYRLTFVSTKNAPATNEYRYWSATEKSGATARVSPGLRTATASIAAARTSGFAPVAIRPSGAQKTANVGNEPASGAVALISKPCVGQLSSPPNQTLMGR